jgi:hypothetical protein
MNITIGRGRLLSLFVLFHSLASVAASGPVGEGEGRRGQGGLAAKYPGDAGIANDPDVLFADNFESEVNCFWLQHYGYDDGDPTKQYWKDSQSVWFDDVVVARRYIGPIRR